MRILSVQRKLSVLESRPYQEVRVYIAYIREYTPHWKKLTGAFYAEEQEIYWKRKKKSPHHFKR